jgi:LPXTG-motif cell wall-anchored protein
MQKVIGILLIVAAIPVIAYATGDVIAPEIDASSAVAGLTLLGGAALVLRGRRKGK